MALRLATWNINSVRLRLPLVLRLLKEEQPDILCLQETKTPDDKFPIKEIEAAGYAHHAIRGEKGYNGVAILSRVPLTDIGHHDFCAKGDTRHVMAKAQGITIHNCYVPAGGDEPDRDKNEKFGHKLDFVDEMAAWLKDGAPSGPSILVGDLNIAPLEEDVWSHKQLLKVVSHTPVIGPRRIVDGVLITSGLRPISRQISHPAKHCGMREDGKNPLTTSRSSQNSL